MGILSMRQTTCPKCGKTVVEDGGFILDHNCDKGCDRDNLYKYSRLQDPYPPAPLRELAKKVELRVGGYHSNSVFTTEEVINIINEIIIELEKEKR